MVKVRPGRRVSTLKKEEENLLKKFNKSHVPNAGNRV